PLPVTLPIPVSHETETVTTLGAAMGISCADAPTDVNKIAIHNMILTIFFMMNSLAVLSRSYVFSTNITLLHT
ncbi:MAG: hypothetical protein RR933_04835, partial [Oscillospiraceae bacterium]